MEVTAVPGGYVILGTFGREEVSSQITDLVSAFPLIIADPPYGNIVPEKWDAVGQDEDLFADQLLKWTRQLATHALDGGALYMWGGTGRPGFRPFYRYAYDVDHTDFKLANHITWGKKRAFGVSHNYLYTREECLYLVKGDIKKPRMFNIPLLEEKRGYAGYNKKYPAKSEFKRRTNVWTDITELFSGKLHTAQKPERLAEVMIETHTSPGDWVLDPFSGSGSTGLAARKLGRRFVLVDSDYESYSMAIDRLSL